MVTQETIDREIQRAADNPNLTYNPPVATPAPTLSGGGGQAPHPDQAAIDRERQRAIDNPNLIYNPAAGQSPGGLSRTPEVTPREYTESFQEYQEQHNLSNRQMGQLMLSEQRLNIVAVVE